MRPPKGFESEKYPLRHRLVHRTQLCMGNGNLNTVLLPIVMSSTDMGVAADTINVNPHNSVNYDEDAGPLVRQMSIIDRLTISIKFNMTHYCESAHLASGTAGPNFDDGVYVGNDIPVFNFLWRPVFNVYPEKLDAAHLASGTAGPNFDDGVYVGNDIPVFNFLWRPIFNVYPEKLDAADDASGTTVAAILGLTKDATFEDIVPVTTNKLPVLGPSENTLAVSTVNDAQAITDFNMTTNFNYEDHVFDEDLLQAALRRYTNKGALRSCLGRTRHVTLTRQRPFKNFYIDKFLPNAIRRVQSYGFMGIQIHIPLQTEAGQQMLSASASVTEPHLGISMITNYHEWNIEHDQGMLTS